MPITEKTVMKTEVIYNDDRTHRYLLRKEWDKAKPKAAIIMLYPSNADTITVDHTTMFVLSNLERLGYGSVAILNLFSSMNGKHSKTDIDNQNLFYITEAVKEVDTIIWAVGTGADNCKKVLEQQRLVLEILADSKSKMRCIANAQGRKFYHPLCPTVRYWRLEEFDYNELRAFNTDEADTEIASTETVIFDNEATAHNEDSKKSKKNKAVAP